MEENIPWELLAKSFAGEASDSEEKDLEIWIQADPVREEWVQQIFDLWQKTGNLYEVDVDGAWDRVYAQMERNKQTVSAATTRDSGRRSEKILNLVNGSKKNQSVDRFYRIGALAAALLVVIMTSLFFSLQNMQSSSDQAVEVAVAQELITDDGEWAAYTLQDGSRVVLHAGSKLTVPPDFNTGHRELQLDGEAYFEVTHDPERPFVVETEQTYTRVLGTRFLVQAWPDRFDEVEVVVVEGKVAFGGRREAVATVDEREVVLSGNQSGKYVQGEGIRVNTNPDLEWYLSWTEGQLVFNDRPLNEIIPRLERWYAVEIQLAADELGDRRLTAELDYTLPMKEVLKGIALTLDIEVSVNGSVVLYH